MQKNFTGHGLPAAILGADRLGRTEDLIWTMMKISMVQVTLAMIFTGMVIANDNYAQKVLDKQVYLNLETVKIKEVLREIETRTDVKFVYSRNHVKLDGKVSISASGASLGKVLEDLLTPFEIRYSVQEVTDYIVLTPGTQTAVSHGKVPRVESPEKAEIVVTGRIANASGATIPGVSVVVRGTTTGTLSDADGAYSINVPDEGAVLVFSSIGFISQEIAVDGRTVINVILEEDVQRLEEVVIVGYGEQKKANLTGSVAAISFDDKITSRAMTNVSSALSGLLPGLAVSQNTGMAGKNDVSLLIRGLGTVNNAEPLVVVDGMPDVDINGLNINDIESISILKDATSSAVYGSRAANGVILITTKTGKGEGKAKINFSSSYAMAYPTGQLSFMADYPRSLTLHQRGQSVNTLRQNYNFKDGTIDQWMALGMIDPLRYPNTDWWDVILRVGQIANHNVSAFGSNDKSNFFVSAGMMDEKGLQINNDYSRYNARFNYDYKLRDNMNIGLKFGGNWSKWLYSESEGFTFFDGAGAYGIVASIAGITPYDPATGLYGGIMAYNENNNAYNPYSVYQLQQHHQNRQEVNPSAYLDWSPVKGLTARVDYAINYYNQFAWYAPLKNVGYNFQTNDFTSLIRIAENAPVSNNINTGYKTQLTGRINYSLTLKENHDISAMLVYSEEYWNARSLSGFRYDRLHQKLHEINAALTTQQSISGTSSAEGLESYIGRLNYSAFDKYLLEASFRYDGSSKFIDERQFGFFPSAALGWRFSEESFFEGFLDRFISSGKVRVSYGGLGNNSGVGRYEQKETLAISNYLLDQVITKGFVNKKMINRDLSWESTYVMNIGLDLGFLKNRLTAEIDYYDRRTTDMNRPSEMSILLTGAYTAPRTNIGDLRNRGVEFNFNWRDQVRELQYNINLNASYNNNRLESWNEYLGRGTTFLGMPLDFLYAYEDVGIAQTWQDVYDGTPQGASPGDIIRLDLNGDGLIDGNDRRAYPQFNRVRPTTNFGLNANLAWRGITFSVLVQGAAGRKDTWLNIFNQPEFSTGRATTWDHWNNSWSVENRNATMPRLFGSNNTNPQQTFWLDDLSYVRLKNVQLGYHIPNQLLTKVGINDIRVYGTAENLLTFTKFHGVDPEKQIDVNDPYPLIKSFSLGINIGI